MRRSSPVRLTSRLSDLFPRQSGWSSYSIAASGFAWLLTFAVMFATLPPAVAQSTPPLVHDAKVTALVAQILAATDANGIMAGGVLVSGKIRFSANGASYPIRIWTLGNDKSRTEIDLSNGTTISILNAGKGTFQDTSGKVRKLATANTIAQRVTILPSLSILREIQSPAIQTEWIGPVTDVQEPAVQFAVGWSSATSAKDIKESLKQTRTTFTVDPTTGRILTIAYQRTFEGGTPGTAIHRLAYSNFGAIPGISAAQTIVTTVNGQFFNRIDLDTITIQPPDPTKFTLAEVTK
jgi:hypothetical protein